MGEAWNLLFLALVGGETIREGYLVFGGGGVHPFDRFEDLIPAECRTGATGVAVFNADSEIEVTRP